MPPAIELVRLKVDGARKHLRELESEVQSFLKNNPYVIQTKRNPDTRLVYHLSKVSQVPITIAQLSGDVLQNLRSALDHLAYQLVLAGTKGTAPAYHVYFPIGDDAKKYLTNKPRMTQGMDMKALSTLDTVKPYRGGNDDLWRLHKLNNIDKHRFLITVGSAFRSLDLGAHIGVQMQKLAAAAGQVVPKVPSLFIRPADRMFPLKVGDELFIDAPDAEENPKMQFVFEVAFEEPEADVRNGEALAETLQRFIQTVDSTVTQFEPLL